MNLELFTDLTSEALDEEGVDVPTEVVQRIAAGLWSCYETADGRMMPVRPESGASDLWELVEEFERAVRASERIPRWESSPSGSLCTNPECRDADLEVLRLRQAIIDMGRA